jgi:hypothetical protein
MCSAVWRGPALLLSRGAVHVARLRWRPRAWRPFTLNATRMSGGSGIHTGVLAAAGQKLAGAYQYGNQFAAGRDAWGDD